MARRPKRPPAPVVAKGKAKRTTMVVRNPSKPRRPMPPPSQRHTNKKKEVRRRACRSNKGRRRDPRTAELR